MQSIKYFILQYRNNEKLLLSLFFIITLIIRSIFVLILYKNNGTVGWSDDWYYLLLGEQIASGNWAPHAPGELYMRVAPLVSLIVAIFTKVFGDPVFPFFIYNILLASILVPVLYYLGKELSGKALGWILAIWGCLNIEFFKYTPHILKEPTIYLLGPLIVLFLVKQRKKENYYYLILAAFFFAVLIHTDERFFIYLPIFPLIIFLGKSFRFKRNLIGISIWATVVFLLMLPWGIRNYMVYGQVVIISHRTTAFTSKLWGKDLSGMKFVNISQIIPDEKHSSENIKQMPEKLPGSSGRSNGFGLYYNTFLNTWRPAYFKSREVKYSWWENPRNQKWSLKHNLASILFYGAFLPFYIIGLIILFIRKNYLILFLGMLPVMHSFLHTYMVMPEERYRYPFVFIIVLIGAWTINEIFHKVVGHNKVL